MRLILAIIPAFGEQTRLALAGCAPIAMHERGMPRASGEVITSRASGEVITSRASGDVITSRASGDVITSRASGEVITSRASGEVITSRASGEVITSRASGDDTVRITFFGHVNFEIVSRPLSDRLPTIWAALAATLIALPGGY